VKTIVELRRIEEALASVPLPRADREWGGADVVISGEAPPPSGTVNFYPEPRYVVTKHSLELSWLFERLRDAFHAESRLDGCSKIEFFGRRDKVSYLSKEAPGPDTAGRERVGNCLAHTLGNSAAADAVHRRLPTLYHPVPPNVAWVGVRVGVRGVKTAFPTGPWAKKKARICRPFLW
jgi:hypothetical protein